MTPSRFTKDEWPNAHLVSLQVAISIRIRDRAEVSIKMIQGIVWRADLRNRIRASMSQIVQGHKKNNHQQRVPLFGKNSLLDIFMWNLFLVNFCLLGIWQNIFNNKLFFKDETLLTNFMYNYTLSCTAITCYTQAQTMEYNHLLGHCIYSLFVWI